VELWGTVSSITVKSDGFRVFPNPRVQGLSKRWKSPASCASATHTPGLRHIRILAVRGERKLRILAARRQGKIGLGLLWSVRAIHVFKGTSNVRFWHPTRRKFYASCFCVRESGLGAARARENEREREREKERERESERERDLDDPLGGVGGGARPACSCPRAAACPCCSPTCSFRGGPAVDSHTRSVGPRLVKASRKKGVQAGLGKMVCLH